MVDMSRRDAPLEGAYPIVVIPEIYEQLRAIAREQAISVNMAAQMVLVDGLQRAGRWHTGAGDGQPTGE